MEEHTYDDYETVVDGDDAVIGKALRISLAAMLVLAAIGTVIFWMVNRPAEVIEGVEQSLVLPATRSQTPKPIPPIAFTDVTQSAGITFVHTNGATGQKLLPETMGGGCAFLDYDGDGDQDLLLVNSTNWDANSPENPTSALFQNDGRGNFEDVTEESGLAINCYGMGAAVGDYDNDGDPDVFITAVGKNTLLRNDGGQYVDITDQAGVAGDANAWSTSCGWFDYDNDGDLDLLVANYVQWSPELDLAQDFQLTGIGRAYGPPFSFQGTFPYLYRNEGDDTFVDASEESGIRLTNAATGVPLAKSLGVAPIDINRDGWMDFILANDTVQNLLFINQHDGTFVDASVDAGIAFDSSGKARGAMGIDTACFRNDACLGVAIGNFANEMSALYVTGGDEPLFTDDAIPCGFGPQTRGDLCFGLFFFDVDLDGRLDLFSANGHLENEINQVQRSQFYRQPPRIFWNAGRDSPSEFVAVAADPNSALSQPLVGRGTAFADIDADGDLDVVVTQVADRPALLRNDTPTEHHFVRLKLRGKHCNRDAIGSWIELQVGDQTLRRQVMPTRSYLSQAELPVTIGLGSATNVAHAKIVWADGVTQELFNLKIDSTTEVEQDYGAASN